MGGLARTLRFATFTLTEYLRSGRVVIELVGAVIYFYLVFRRWGAPMSAEQHFSNLGIGMVLLSAYTGSAIAGLGDRPQGYILLVRRLSRAGYLLGLYLATLAIVLTIYALFTLAAWLHNWPVGLTVEGWAMGALPLVLNVMLVVAVMLMLSPLVFGAGWRLLVLLLIALAFSGNVLSGPQLRALPEVVGSVLSSVRTVLAYPLLPAFSGFELSVTRDYAGAYGLGIVLAQLFLTLFVLAISVYAFARRELIFSQS